jgi:hypothetical protein
MKARREASEASRRDAELQKQVMSDRPCSGNRAGVWNLYENHPSPPELLKAMSLIIDSLRRRYGK